MVSMIRSEASTARFGFCRLPRAFSIAAALLAAGQLVLAGGIGDFDGDGRADVLLRHEDGRWYYYPMNGRRQVAGGRGSANLTRDLEWSVACIGDLDGDSRADVLLRHEDGRWYYYPMNGRRHVADGRGLADVTRDREWSLAGTGDFDGDGRADVLLRHADGRWYYYPMNGRHHAGGGGGIANLTRNLAWSLESTGDFDGDGRADVLLRHADGRWYYYAMNGRRPVAGSRGFANLTGDVQWSLAGTGDFNGDGRDDVLLRHADGRWYYYAMNGRRFISGQEGIAQLPWDLSRRLGGGGGGDGVAEPDESFRDCAGCPKMVAIPSGTFRMGCLNDDGDCHRDEFPVHAVMIGYAFALSATEVTRAEFARFVEETGYSAGDSCWIWNRGWENAAGRNWRNPGYSQSDVHPVVCVNWEDARAYARWLSEKAGETYRLPSESEWEYAVRAGTETKYHWGDEIGSNRANCRRDLCAEEFRNTSPVGSFPANAWGLHDMHGNAWEWVEDCWNGSYEGAPDDGSAWESGDCSARVLRGGSWGVYPMRLRAAFRNLNTVGIRSYRDGFRVARTLDP